MKILFTNIQISQRSGTEIVVRDLALRFGELGHDVTVYSPVIGELASEIRSANVRVIDNLRDMDGAPDIIHGHHTPSTVEAIVAFPSVPAIWVCHDATSWYDHVPRFSQVRRIFAVDETCRARLVSSEGLLTGDVEILPNAVDLRRFQARSKPLPVKPVRAVSLVKHSGPTELIVEACRIKGLSLELYGHGVARAVRDIERLSAENDIVFATARTALEAMAVGAAVILVDGRGFAGPVTSQNFEMGRRLNFGLGLLTRQPTLEALIDAIDSYDSLDAAAVSQRVRYEADLDSLITRLEDIYSSTISQWQSERDFDGEKFRAEQIEFNRVWLPRPHFGGPWMEEMERLRHQVGKLNDALTMRTNELLEWRHRESARIVRFARKLHQWTASWRR